jgi:hypothetical protein
MTESLAARTVGWAGIILLLVGFAFYALNFRQGPIEIVHGTVLSSSVLPSEDPAPLTLAQVRLPNGHAVAAEAFHGLPAPGSLVSVRVYRQALTGGRSYEIAPPGRGK